MQITDIRIRKVATPGKLRALVSVTFDEDFVVHDMKIIEGDSGFFIAMPSRLTPQGKHKDIAHPTNSFMRATLQAQILEAYADPSEAESPEQDDPQP